MWIVIFFIFTCLGGFILFRKNTISYGAGQYIGRKKLSVIIPARNEEKNLPFILRSLMEQTYPAYEIIVVDDHSDDQTKEIAQMYNVKVIDNPELPSGWTGKTWAVWNGYKHSSGDVIAFLDADIRLTSRAIESLLNERAKRGGVISVVPYHETKRFYEKFALITNILGMISFTSPFEKRYKRKGLYGSCIIVTRADYEKVKGHYSIQSEILDDLTLGAKFMEAGVKVTNFIGTDMVSFRMYPNGLKSELQGFAKGAVLSTSSLSPMTLFFVIVWLIGLIFADSFLIFISSHWFVPLLTAYILYTIQILYLVKYVGNFGKLMPLVHILSTIFFLVIILYSFYQVVFLRHVTWKGRNVKVGRRERL